jgi:hypothetical protein
VNWASPAVKPECRCAARWPRAAPFADKKALGAAQKLGLGKDAGHLADVVEQRDYFCLVAALIRTYLARDYDDIIDRASALVAKAFQGPFCRLALKLRQKSKIARARTKPNTTRSGVCGMRQAMGLRKRARPTSPRKAMTISVQRDSM